MIKDVDVAVLGGGPAGCATALALAHDGYSVVLVERSAYDKVRVGETLPPAVQMLLRSLGVWGHFVRDAHSASPGIHCAWGQPDLHENDFIFNPYGMGWHIDRRRFDAMLARVVEEAGASVYRGAPWTSSEGSTAKREICIVQGDERLILRTRFVVDATGRASALARKEGATRISYDRLVGVVVFFFLSRDENSLGDCTLVEAVEDGWWYSALLPNHRLVVAYMTDADLYARGPRLSIHYWQEQLRKTKHTQALIKSLTLQSGPFIVAANSSRLDQLSGRSWLAIGDAATAFDPLSSQGVYKALESGIRAARAIQNYFAGNGTALGSYAAEMEEYFDYYLLMRNKYYGRETRWLRSAFWQRRRLGYR